MIKVALAEDNVFLGQNMMDQLTANPDIQFKFWAQNGKSLLESLATGELVDLVIMDIEMPVMNGIEATSIINQQYPHIKIMMSTVFDDDEAELAALKIQATARGRAIRKQRREEEVAVTKIQAVARGRKVRKSETLEVDNEENASNG